MNQLLITVLTLVGSIAMFSFGIKALSGGMQKITGQRVRKALGTSSSLGFITILKGAGSSMAVQSSTATTVMIVNSVNAGVMNLRQAIWGILGANIGTTSTAWFILLFGYVIGDVFPFWFLLFIVGVILFNLNGGHRKNWGESLIGIAIVFTAVYFLKEATTALYQSPEIGAQLMEFSQYNGMGRFMLFLAIGTLFTILVRASATTSALALVLIGSGMSFELGAAIIIGENLGTTITALLAAANGNVHAKRAARSHFSFNIIGAALMIIGFIVLSSTFDSIDQYVVVGSENQIQTRQFWVCVLHSGFNVLPAIILSPFIAQFTNALIRFVPPKGEDDEEFRLALLSPSQQSGDLALMDARNEVHRLARIVAKMSGTVMELLSEGDPKRIPKLHSRVKRWEEETDDLEITIAEYLSNLSQSRLSERGSQEVSAMLSVVMDLEKQGDIFFQMARIVERKADSRTYFLPKQRANLYSIFNLVDDFIQEVINVVKNSSGEIDMRAVRAKMKEIKSIRKKLHKDHISDIEKGKYSMKSGVAYTDLISSLERVAELCQNIQETLVPAD